MPRQLMAARSANSVCVNPAAVLSCLSNVPNGVGPVPLVSVRWSGVNCVTGTASLPGALWQSGPLILSEVNFMIRRLLPALAASVALLFSSGGVHAQSIIIPIPLRDLNFNSGPPQDYGLDQWWSMSLQFPGGQDGINASSPNDVVRVPWTNVIVPVGVQLTENGAATADDWADFSAQLQLCLTPPEAAAYPMQNEPWDWRSFTQMLGPASDPCTQQPYGTLGNWYTVLDDGGAAEYPYSIDTRLNGGQSSVSGVMKLNWHLPFISNTLRLHLIVNSSIGSDDQLTEPVNLMVLPAALMQLKVLPYTILYAPPGANSTATYQGSTSFATTMTVGSNTSIDDTESEHRTNSNSDNIAASAFGLSFNL